MVKKLLISIIFMLSAQNFAIFGLPKVKDSFENRLALEGNTIEGVRSILKLYPNKRKEIIKKIQSNDFEEAKSVIQALDLCAIMPELRENPKIKSLLHAFVEDRKDISTFIIEDVLSCFKDKKTKEDLFKLLYTEKRNIYCPFALKKLLRIFPDKRNHFFKNIANNFKYNPGEVGQIIEIYPDKKEALFNLIENNHSNYGLYDFIELTEIWPNKKDYLSNKIIECLSMPCEISPYYIIKVARLCPKKSALLLKTIISNRNCRVMLEDSFSTNTLLNMISDREQKDLLLKKILEESTSLNDFEVLSKIDCIRAKEYLNAIPKTLPEYRHARSSQVTSEQAFQLIFSTSNRFSYALEKKDELKGKGFESFFHGQKAEFGLLEDLTKDIINNLHELGLSQRLREDFLFIQNSEIFAENHEEILTMARREHNNMIENRQEEEVFRKSNRLSANILLNGNSSNIGSCTLEYVLANANVNSFPLDIDTFITKPLNLPKSFIGKYKSRFNDILEIHRKLFKKGRLLLIAIPKEKVDEYVYLAKTGAYRTKHKTIDGKEMDTASEFIETLQNAPEKLDFKTIDRGSEVAIPLTNDYLLNPYSDVKIFAFDDEPTDEELYKKYLEERKKLAQDIAKDVVEINAKDGSFEDLELCCDPKMKLALKSVQKYWETHRPDDLM